MIAIVQPIVPHFREEFFKGLCEEMPCDIFCYDEKNINLSKSKKILTFPLRSIQWGPFVLYSPQQLFNESYKVWVLMLNFSHLTTWLLLLTKVFHKRKIILWGHGISVKRYLQEEQKSSFLLKSMLKMADGAWFYTENELQRWQKEIPQLNAVSLNNTISDLDNILNCPPVDKTWLRQKYGINENRVLIYCTRFEDPKKRVDLLVKAIKSLPDVGFIVIGQGKYKPNFNSFKNVYDFGGVYDRQLKNELFIVADAYFQPAWLGLSVVEAMAYAKPIFTFKRSLQILQCVEYAYIQPNRFGLVFNQFDDFVITIRSLSQKDLEHWGIQAKQYVSNHLSMQQMVHQATTSLKTTLHISTTQTMKILLLWAPLADYTVACLRRLAMHYPVELHLVYQPPESNAPYDPFDLSFCEASFSYQEKDKKKIEAHCMALVPDAIIMSSWNYPFYMKIAKRCKQQGTYVLSTFDGQWKRTLKQYLGILTSRIFLKPAINNFFVPGDRQMIFARKLGYKNPLQGYYSANSTHFKSIDGLDFSNQFIFVGRLTKIKGLDVLLEAYQVYRQRVKSPWGLTVVGKGELEKHCRNQTGVEVHKFVQPAHLTALLKKASCFVLPSRFEPWGVVIHEAALCGLPLIVSHECGASTYFVRDGQNGYVINPDRESLASAMIKIAQTSPQELKNMAQISKHLGELWNEEKWAEYVFRNLKLMIRNNFQG